MEKYVYFCLTSCIFCKTGLGVKDYVPILVYIYLIGFGDQILATFRLQYEDGYVYEFYMLNTRLKFEGRKFSKCACSELKTRTRPLTPIWRSLMTVSTAQDKIQCGISTW